MNRLLDQLAAEPPDYLRGVVGVVAAVGSGSRTVDLLVSSSFVPSVPVSAAYATPTEGDVVFVVKLGSSWHVAYSLGAPPPTASSNLVYNGGFELGQVGDNTPLSFARWASQTPVTSVVADAHSGTQAWRVPVLGGMESFLAMSSAALVSPSTQYRLGVWAKVNIAMNTNERMRLEFWGGAVDDPLIANGAGPNNTTGDKIIGINLAVTSTTWRYYEVVITSTSTTQWARVATGFSANAATTRGITLTVDDLTLRPV